MHWLVVYCGPCELCGHTFLGSGRSLWGTFIFSLSSGGCCLKIKRFILKSTFHIAEHTTKLHSCSQTGWSKLTEQRQPLILVSVQPALHYYRHYYQGKMAVILRRVNRQSKKLMYMAWIIPKWFRRVVGELVNCRGKKAWLPPSQIPRPQNQDTYNTHTHTRTV